MKYVFSNWSLQNCLLFNPYIGKYVIILRIVITAIKNSVLFNSSCSWQKSVWNCNKTNSLKTMHMLIDQNKQHHKYKCAGVLNNSNFISIFYKKNISNINLFLLNFEAHA